MSQQPWFSPASLKLSAAMADSFARLTGEDLVSESVDDDAGRQLAAAMYWADFGLLCHDGSADPLFTYANACAQRLWAMNWSEIVGLASRYSAQPSERETRAKMLERAAAAQLIEDYSGVRIAADGQRFEIAGATIWTVTDDVGTVIGQAAKIPRWTNL